MVCFCYFLFVMPIALVNIIDDTSTSPKLHLALFCIYWLQYSLNFFIYAARSEQYRKAYWYFLRKVIQHFTIETAQFAERILNEIATTFNEILQDEGACIRLSELFHLIST